MWFHLSDFGVFVINQVVEVPNVSWEDIGGLENVKRELQEVTWSFYVELQIHIFFLIT